MNKEKKRPETISYRGKGKSRGEISFVVTKEKWEGDFALARKKR